MTNSIKYVYKYNLPERPMLAPTGKGPLSEYHNPDSLVPSLMPPAPLLCPNNQQICSPRVVVGRKTKTKTIGARLETSITHALMCVGFTGSSIHW